MVWYRVRNFARSWCILIIVLLLHGALLYFLLKELAPHTQYHDPTERMRETAPVFIMDAEQEQTTLQPQQIQNQSVTKPEPTPPHFDAQAEPEPPQPIDPLQQPPEDMLFASLYQKLLETEEQETIEQSDPEEPEPIQQKSTLPEKLSLVTELEKKEKKITPESIAPKKAASKPPHDVATDDIPMAFEGVHTTQLSEKDSLFHTFIKAVNTALYKSMKEGNPPFAPGIQPVVVRMIIVRTGRLAQRPTIIRSSGSAARDLWYIDAIIRASASFPPIPQALHLPFAEMMFKEGSKGQAP